MNQNAFFESFCNTNSIVKIIINNQQFEVDKKVIERSGKGGILDILFKQKAGTIMKGESIILHGDEEKARQLKEYISFIETNQIYVQNLSLYEVAQKVMDLICCGVDLGEALDYFNARDGSGDVVGEILCIMGESFTTNFVQADQQGTWQKMVYEGLQWAFANRPEQIQNNSDLLSIIYQKYNGFKDI
ncbi:hypothetical protein KM1_183910 [Entamoeba histolytica HM-3:IMSS]|uniref:Uncharacterized protein n=5 Tax=Entamoeba histolytica TaxID=5759 RepID=C4M747_ENTH1|nr:hypothetical protein EHI_192060 [Entamoeba histolytica HM-1:IMSS]EAL44957.1 hypothetical protein EHI_192060 [Entamoeba histolytica HM-1:IMSS]EMS13909.1 hypothetical protein KM1_183910 [Entamoeba histolytica HM-3:IMSS]ENY63585.1 hypothetical protein EHI7A_104800 [Entamoeba histolytica HM-1:IMSS-A]GAT97336.1 hypothetical protein CL6EHI_192060 [Entamoeba histolytica]|eukprot:XP_650345.1 hypothetical protein EHI_192060 [Entamoeba histolytica HM-1:IMSS]